MGVIGSYNKRFTWYRFARTQDSTYGDVPQMYASNGSLWGRIKFINGSEPRQDDTTLSVLTAQIFLHNEIGLRYKDKLAESVSGNEWHVSGWHYDELTDETIVSVVREGEADE